MGTWCNVIPTTGSQAFNLSRKGLDGSATNTRTSDGGATWTSSGVTYNETTNEYTWITVAGQVGILAYTAEAKVTKPSINKSALNGNKGLMPVFATCASVVDHGVLLHESLTGNIGKSVNGAYRGSYELTQFEVHGGNGELPTNADYLPQHTAINLGAPNNNSPAVSD